MARRPLLFAGLLGLALVLGLVLWLLGGGDTAAEDTGARPEAPAASARLPAAEDEAATPLPVVAQDAGAAPASAAPAGVSTYTADGELELAFSGRVVDPQGRGVAGAQVDLLRSAGYAGLSGVPEMEPPEMLATATSDAAGRFRLAAPEGEVLDGLNSLSLLRAAATGWAPVVRPVVAAPGGDAQLGDLVLGIGARVLGRVVTSDGVPVVGALVSARRANSPAGAATARALQASESAHTSADGSFLIDAARAGQADLLVVADGRPQFTHKGLALEEGRLIDAGTLTLPKGGTLSGRLLDRTDIIAGGTVHLVGAAARKLAKTTSDEHGLFSFEGLDASVSALEGEAPGHLSARVSVTLPSPGAVDLLLPRARVLRLRAVDGSGQPVTRGHVELLAGGDERGRADFVDGVAELEVAEAGWVLILAEGCAAHVEDVTPASLAELEAEPIRLFPECVVRCRAHDLQDQPIAGLRVHVNGGTSPPSKEGYGAQAVTGADGRCELRHLSPGEWTLRAERPGFRSGRFGGTLAEREVLELDMPFAPGGRIEGRVIDAAGAPRPLVEVGLSVAKRRTLTDEAGAFGFEGLAAGGVSVSTAGVAPVSVTIVVNETAHVDLVTPQAALLTGRVHARGRPAAGAVVKLQGGLKQSLEVETDVGGGFRLEGVTPGDWRATAQLADGLPRATQEFVVQEGGRPHVDLDVGGTALRVLVKSAEDGRPLAGALVRAELGNIHNTKEMPTDSQGALVLPDMPAGEVRLLVRADLRTEIDRRVELAGELEKEVEFTLHGAARVEGRLSAADGGTLPVTVVLRPAGWEAEEAGQVANWSFHSMRPVGGTGERQARVKGSAFVFEHVPVGPARLLVMQNVSTDPRKREDVELAAIDLDLVAGEIARPEIIVQPVRGK